MTARGQGGDGVPGIVLAGGAARRMGGGDKGLLPLGGSTVMGMAISRLEPQVAALAISANGDPARFGAAHAVLPDGEPDRPGPLAGVLAGLDWAAGMGFQRIVTAAADTPFLPLDLAARLREAARGAPIALAATSEDGRIVRHPTFGLWPVALRDDLRAAIRGGVRKVVAWTDRHGAATALFPDPDAFFNVNTPEDLERARAMCAS